MGRNHGLDWGGRGGEGTLGRSLLERATEAHTETCEAGTQGRRHEAGTVTTAPAAAVDVGPSGGG